jgi:hypothetical protein
MNTEDMDDSTGTAAMKWRHGSDNFSCINSKLQLIVRIIIVMMMLTSESAVTTRKLTTVTMYVNNRTYRLSR